MSKEQPPKEFVPVTNEKEARSLIQESIKTFAPAIIWTKDQDKVINTHLAGMEGDEGVAHVYAWVPKDVDVDDFIGSLQKHKTRECYFSVALSRANVFFRTNFVGVDPSGMRFEIPSKIFKVQRRKNFRLPIPDGYVVRVEFPNPLFPERKVSKKVLDISAGGLSFIVPPEEEALFRSNMEIQNIVFKIRNRAINASAEVRYMKLVLFDPKIKGIKVGIAFKKISPADIQHIAAYVFEESRKYFSKFF